MCPKIKNPCIKKRKRVPNIKEAFFILLKFLRIPLKLVNFSCQSKYTQFIKNIIDIIFKNALHEKYNCDKKKKTLGKVYVLKF